MPAPWYRRTETLITHSLGQDGWYLHQILSRQQLIKQRQIYLLLIAAICVVILSLGMFMVLSLSRTINQPVARIQKKIDKIAHGDFTRDTSIEWEHELGDIGKGIDRLAFDVVNLMEKRIDDEKEKKDLEYQILQSQINPHFLYNTLNSINWMATIQGSPGIAEMTTALARLLRQVSKGSSSMITLEEELALVKDYFLIQQYRYGGGITIEYEIESQELYQCLIHRFSLQPIVENALFHGIEPKGSTGKILVKAWTDTGEGKKDLRISITDNGVGMSREAIEKVLEQKPAKKSADFFRQVGIANVNQRIRHQFGGSYGISIDSQPGVYTTMTRIPITLWLTARFWRNPGGRCPMKSG
ncbi:MAG: sensor histidine kinase [Hungatella sp.]|nr:sensor histidine kinase [Hungatella sp.]